MQTKKKFIQHYKDNFMPWAHEKPDFNLVEIVDNWPIKPCRTLEPGCGTGTDSIWLSQQGFKTTAYDGSPIAIDKALENAKEFNAKVNFQTVDFLTESLAPNEFDFVFDRGFFHCFNSLNERKEIAKRISTVLKKNGLWLSLIGNADGIKTDPGPPLLSAEKLVKAIEPFFKILSIRASHFGNEQEEPPRIWVCLMRKRH
ncbi:MAG: methyltransferase type 11 [Bacteroidetes bacterium]|nr:methyltransferase type 11 [Bacteroidota bacterium]